MKFILIWHHPDGELYSQSTTASVWDTERTNAFRHPTMKAATKKLKVVRGMYPKCKFDIEAV